MRYVTGKCHICKAVCGTFFRNGADRAGAFVLGECRDRQDISCRLHRQCTAGAENICVNDKFPKDIKCARRSLQFGAECVPCKPEPLYAARD